MNNKIFETGRFWCFLLVAILLLATILFFSTIMLSLGIKDGKINFLNAYAVGSSLSGLMIVLFITLRVWMEEKKRKN